MVQFLPTLFEQVKKLLHLAAEKPEFDLNTSLEYRYYISSLAGDAWRIGHAISLDFQLVIVFFEIII